MKPMTRILIGLEGLYYGLDIDASGWGIIKQSGDVIGEGSVKDQVIISVSDYVLIFERIS